MELLAVLRYYVWKFKTRSRFHFSLIFYVPFNWIFFPIRSSPHESGGIDT